MEELVLSFRKAKWSRSPKDRPSRLGRLLQRKEQPRDGFLSSLLCFLEISRQMRGRFENHYQGFLFGFFFMSTPKIASNFPFLHQWRVSFFFFFKISLSSNWQWLILFLPLFSLVLLLCFTLDSCLWFVFSLVIDFAKIPIDPMRLKPNQPGTD